MTHLCSQTQAAHQFTVLRNAHRYNLTTKEMEILQLQVFRRQVVPVRSSGLKLAGCEPTCETEKKHTKYRKWGCQFGQNKKYPMFRTEKNHHINRWVLQCNGFLCPGITWKERPGQESNDFGGETFVGLQ